MKTHTRMNFAVIGCILLLVAVPLLMAQTGETATPQQAPRTAPQVKEVLPSYEGQNVTTVELAGQPEIDTTQLVPLLAQRGGEPFSQAKVNQSIAALERTGRFQGVEIEIRPEPKGIRVLLILQPATYFGIYEFPGTSGRFPYSRLLQVAEYPPRGAYTPVDVENARQALETFFKRSGYFRATVEPHVQVDQQHGLANVIYNVNLNRRAKFGDVKITGTTPDETARLEKSLHGIWARLKSSAIRPGKTFSPKILKNASQYLENTLMKQGYLGAQVRLLGAEYDPQTNRADINFNVQTGPVVHVKLQGAHVWGWTQRKLLPLYQQAGLGAELIQEGRQNLLSYFQSKGYFDVKVDTKTEQQPSGETIYYQITKGPRHKVAEVDVAGNEHLSDKELMGHVKVEKGHFFSHGKYSEKLVRASVNDLKRIYQANGFSDVKVTPQITTRGSGNLVVKFRVDEGTQDIVETLKIDGNNTQTESALAPHGLKVVPGRAYSQKLVDEDRNQIMAQYLRKGYLNATFRATANTVGNDKHRLEVVYHIMEGPQVEIAKVVMLGRNDTKPSLIDRSLKLKAGQPLRTDDMLTSENELYNLGIFDWAEIDPRRQITTQTKEDALIKVHEAKKNTITYGFGFEVINRGGSVPSGTVAVPGLPPVGLPNSFKTSQKTFWGPRGTFEYTRKNLRGKAETFTIAGLGARLDQRGNITYSNPHFRYTDWSSNLTISGEHNSENPIFTSRQAAFSAQLQHALNEDKTQNIFLRYTFSQTGLTKLLIPDLIPAQDQHVRLSTLAASYIRDTRDNPLDAHKGIYESAEFDLNPSALGSSVNYARLRLQAAYYRKIPANIIWANSVRIGLAQQFAGSHVPVSEEFFSGGGSTLRGFSLNGAGPQRTIPACGNPADKSTCSLITVPVGGNQLLIINSEMRIPVPLDLPLLGRKLGVAAFYDGGNVFRTIGFHDFGANYTNSIGGGLRYSTPVGPVRIDIGHNLNAPPGIKSTQIFVTLGQAF